MIFAYIVRISSTITLWGVTSILYLIGALSKITVLDPKSWTQPYVNIVNRLVAGPFVVSAIAVQTQRE